MRVLTVNPFLPFGNSQVVDMNRKAFIVVPILAIIIFVVWRLPVAEYLSAAVSWIRGQGIAGWLTFLLLYILSTVFLLPGSILTLGAGFAWGVAGGTAIVSVASTLGAGAAFLVGRHLARSWVAGKTSANERFARLDGAVADSGFRIVLLTRLSPVFPFNLLNYAYGLTGISLRDYILASWLGMLPGTPSVDWRGHLYDCDFNQMLELEIAGERKLSDVTVDDLRGRQIITGMHCFGCTAGCGSSCEGALDA